MSMILNSLSAQNSNHYILSPITIILNGDTSLNVIGSEVLNSTNYSSEAKLTQGFLQPELFVYLDLVEQEANFFRIYPNPVFDGVYIEFKKDCGDQISGSIYNNLGQEIRSFRLEIDFRKRVYLPLEELNPGVYLISLYDMTEGQRNTIKFIKE